MKRKKFFLLPVFILVVASIACNAELPQMESTATPTPAQLPTVALTIESGQGNIPLSEAGVPRISVEDAKAAFDAGEAVIVDVRSADAYAAGHAEGAINILLGVFETDIANIPLEKDQWIITYCTWQNEHTSARAAFLLLQNGYTHVEAILGGLSAWVDAGYPVVP